MHETATVWRDLDDVARDAGVTIRWQVHERYGIDVDAPGADTAAVAAALAQAERGRTDTAAKRVQLGRELTTAQLLFAQADRHERDAQDAAEKDTTGSYLDQAAEILAPSVDAERRSDTDHENAKLPSETVSAGRGKAGRV